ncbi:MAG: biotin/lipoyl-containing protein [Liquorilactobacillus ghanensis]|uniref:acetyl-CoA carboxylase biotin carboxyl carrier protein n=1 Tax=Liquorilactobacillus ghanensis TaxID=399370 RepID=UPI0039E7B3F1
MEIDKLKTLVQLFNEAGLSKLEIKSKNEQITLEKKIKTAAASSPLKTATVPAAVVEDQTVVKAPFIGTFYTAPDPKAAPFVKVGDQVTAGQQLGIIEAMKMMNEIKSPITGKVIKVQAVNGVAVEYDQPLFTIQK